MCLVSFRVFYVDYLKSVVIQNKCVFNKHESYIIFLYYIILYFIVLILYFILFKKFFYFLFILFILFILLLYFINIILYIILLYYIFIFISKTHLLNAFLYKMNLKYFLRYSTFSIITHAYITCPNCIIVHLLR